MYTLIAENKYGQQLELTHNRAYEIVEITGIDPPDSTINTTHNADYDGSAYNSSYMNNRVITITMAINSPAEANRINLYHYFKSKFPVRLYYKNGVRDVYIDGYVQNMPISYFAQKQVAQITILCPKPHFNGGDVNIQPFSSVTPMFEFPFSIPEEGAPFSELELNLEKVIFNNGDIETGALITIRALGALTTPKIYNVDTGEHMIFDVSMESGDRIEIDTIKGEKSMVFYPASGSPVNIIGKLQQGSTWLQLAPGDNVFTVAADVNPENMEVIFSITDQYEGV